MNLKHLTSCIFLLFLFSGCFFPQETATLYVPNKQSHHLLHKQHDYRVAGGIKLFDVFHDGLFSGELQAAYSPIKHIGVLANYSYINKQAVNEANDFDKRILHFGEVALDFYLPIFNDERKKNIFELMVGYGLGDATDFRGGTFVEGGAALPLEDRFYAKSSRIFGQLNYGFKYASEGNARLTLGPSIRLSKVHIYDIQHISNARTLPLDNPKLDMFGLGFHSEVGGKNVQFHYYLFYEVPMNAESRDFYTRYVDGRDAVFHTGFGVKFGF